MEFYLILARSITYAQRMEQALGKIGIRCRISRAPRELTQRGCAYAVRLSPPDLPGGLTALRRAGLEPLQVFGYQNGAYQEVPV